MINTNLQQTPAKNNNEKWSVALMDDDPPAVEVDYATLRAQVIRESCEALAKKLNISRSACAEIVLAIVNALNKE